MESKKRQSLLDAYHERGIAVMLSLFGSTDAPTSKEKCDPVKFADEVANFTLQYGFDGVDADYEDFDAMNAGEAVAWLTRRLETPAVLTWPSIPEETSGEAANPPDLARSHRTLVRRGQVQGRSLRRLPQAGRRRRRFLQSSVLQSGGTVRGLRVRHDRREPHAIPQDVNQGAA